MILSPGLFLEILFIVQTTPIILVDLPRESNPKIGSPAKCHTGPHTETPAQLLFPRSILGNLAENHFLHNHRTVIKIRFLPEGGNGYTESKDFS